MPIRPMSTVHRFWFAVALVITMLILAVSQLIIRAREKTPSLSESDFLFLKTGMSFREITNKVGQPAKDIGSGLYIYVYPLSNGTEIHLSFASSDSLVAAARFDPRSQEAIDLLSNGTAPPAGTPETNPPTQAP